LPPPLRCSFPCQGKQSWRSAAADTITMTITGTVAPYQFHSGYYIEPVIDQLGLVMLWARHKKYILAATVLFIPFSLAEGLTAKECLQSAEALAHKTKELDTRAALLEFAYEFRTVAKRLERDERKLMVRAASDGTQKHCV
jgi:hypothetical protein